jgi:TrmH family RNA methyltransferase
VHTITSRQNPLVTLFRAVARGRPAAGPRMLLDGPHLVREALAAGVAMSHAAFSTRGFDAPEIRSLATALERAGVAVHVVSDAVMDAISPVAAPAGVVAVGDRPAMSAATVFERRPQLVLIGAGIQDPGNVGAMVRAAEAGGATGVVFAGASADPFGWKALRGAMGSAFRVPIAADAGIDRIVDAARASGARVLAAAPRGGRSVFEVDLRGPVAFLLGGEGPGLDTALTRAADEVVVVPMHPPVESLNVAVAAALLIYEAYRQRHSSPDRGPRTSGSRSSPSPPRRDGHTGPASRPSENRRTRSVPGGRPPRTR